ncbi:MAG: hypothetical protein FWE14_00695 [Lachnospiraceae bacterium]|nr:hypothetical protein [Lachnospiraceae bacterium]
MKQYSLAEIFYLSYLIILFFAKGIGLYDGQFAFKICLIIAIFCYGMKMIMTTYSWRELIIIALLIIIGGFTYLNSGEKGAIIYIMMVTGMKNVPLDRIFKTAFVTWVISFGGMFFLTATRIIDSSFKIHERFGLGFLIRWGLGHSHPNVLHISYFTLVTFAMYLQYKSWLKISTLKLLALLMLGNLYVYLYSLSTTGFVAVSFLLALNLYWYYRKRFCLLEKILVTAFLPICLFLSFGVPLLLTGQAFDMVNRIVNTRLNLSKHFLTNVPISLFGTKLSEVANHWYTMDNSFLFAYVIYGVILFIIVMIAYFTIIHKFLKEQKGIELGLIIATLAAGVTEPFLFNTSFKNIPLFFLGILIFTHPNNNSPLKILPERLRMICISLPDFALLLSGLRNKYGCLQSNCRQLYLVFAAASLIGILLCSLIISYPDGYIAPRKHCEMKEKNTSIYLDYDFGYDSITYLDEKKMKVLEYIDIETPMEYFTGNIVILERVRDKLTFGIVIGGLGIFIYLLIVKRKDELLKR